MLLMCNGRLLVRSWIKCVMLAERWLVGPLDPEILGREGSLTC